MLFPSFVIRQHPATSQARFSLFRFIRFKIFSLSLRQLSPFAIGVTKFGFIFGRSGVYFVSLYRNPFFLFNSSVTFHTIRKSTACAQGMKIIYEYDKDGYLNWKSNRGLLSLEDCLLNNTLVDRPSQCDINWNVAAS